MDNPIFCAETNRQETKHESVNNITLFIFVQNRKKILTLQLKRVPTHVICSRC